MFCQLVFHDDDGDGDDDVGLMMSETCSLFAINDMSVV